MNKKITIPIGIGIVIIIIGTILISNQESDSMEVEDVIDGELLPTEGITPEVQKKIDEIKKTNLENDYIPKEREWITSGPFQIDRSEYVIGESIFIRMGGIDVNEKGQIAIMRPVNSTHHKVYLTIPFDGTDKSTSNTYFTPQISKHKGICSMEDITGELAVVFRGTDYPNIEFKINENILPGTDVESVC